MNGTTMCSRFESCEACIYSGLDSEGEKPCKRCGRCCGIIPVTQSELDAIDEYLKEHRVVPRAGRVPLCPFLGDDVDRVRLCTI